MSATTRLLHGAWRLACAGESRAFHRATQHVEAAQRQVLMESLRANHATEFGRAHGFAAIGTCREFQRAVPLSRHEDYAAAVAAIAAGRQGVLTAAPVELLEPTSGSTGGEKLIPFTRPFRRQFQRAVAVWMHDLLTHRPALRHGRAYWSISPALPARRTAGGGRIGFDDDAEYLGAAGRWMMRRLLAVPGDVARVPDLAVFRYATLWHLLRAEDLALVSVWSPTFLTTLLAPLEEWAAGLCADIERGTLTPPESPRSSPTAVRAGLPDPRRARTVQEILHSNRPRSEKLRALWPRLALVSSWADASAAPFHNALRELLPHVEHQPKGLLATEGCVSFPLLDRPAPVLAIRSHFFEFQEADSDCIRLAHELEAGGRYHVILTTAGGLYRYQLRDLVEVVGFENACPLLRFLGKSDGVSDLVGEKLAEPFCREALARVLPRMPAFALLIPVRESLPRYRLYLQEAARTDESGIDASRLAGEFETALARNPHYAYAVGLGQLAPVEVIVLDPTGPSAWALYERHCLALGMRAGNIKPVLLECRAGWEHVFDSIPAVQSETRPACGGARA